MKSKKELVEGWATAVQNKNLNGALAKHADDIVMFNVPFPLQSKGLDEYKKTWQLFFVNNRGGQESFNILELNIQSDENAGYCFGLIKVFHSIIRLIMGFHKVKGQWQISHEHPSYPIQ